MANSQRISSRRIQSVANGFILVPDYANNHLPCWDEHFVFSTIQDLARHLETLTWSHCKEDRKEVGNG